MCDQCFEDEQRYQREETRAEVRARLISEGILPKDIKMADLPVEDETDFSSQ